MKKKQISRLVYMTLAFLLVFSQFSSVISTPTSAEEANLALNQPVTVSGLEVDGKWTGEMAVDGDKQSDNSRWSGNVMKGSDGPQEPSWIAIDLEADKTTADEIKISFYKLVWGTDYEIQTSATAEDGTWETVDQKSKGSSNEQNPTDTFTSLELKRYMRVYFNEMNTNAWGNAISVREIEIYGAQDGLVEPELTAENILEGITELEALSSSDTKVKLPEVPESHSIYVKGSDDEQTIANDGTVTSHNIGEKTVSLLIEVKNKNDESDVAKKNLTVVVPDHYENYAAYHQTTQTHNEIPGVVPEIQEWYGFEGDFELTPASKIIYNDTNSTGLEFVANNMQADLLDITGMELSVQPGTTYGADDIFIQTTDTDTYGTGNEGYMINTDENGIIIEATTQTGALYGTISLEQILWLDKTHDTIPMGIMRDYPKFEIRGIMPDIARNPQREQFIEDTIKMMTWYKLNELHMHINDDFGGGTSWENLPEGMFRLESKEFPSLKTTKNDRNATKYDFNYYYDVFGDPHYSQETYKTWQKNADHYGIDMITEIDGPGHSAAFNSYAHKNPDNIGWLEGGTENPRNFQLLDLVGDNADRARQFITTLLSEYVTGEDPVFTSDTVHIGADEYWGATAAEDAEVDNYISDLYDIANDAGKTVRMWGNRSYAVPEDVVIDIWSNGYDDPNFEIDRGNKIINASNRWVYGNPGRDRRDVMNYEYTYENWTPYNFDAANDNVLRGEPLLLGAKTAIWGDENRRGILESDTNDRHFRSMAVIAEKTWSDKEDTVPFEDYWTRVETLEEGPGTAIAMDIDSKTEVAMEFDFENATDKKVYDASGNGYDAVLDGVEIAEIDGEFYGSFDGEGVMTTPLKTIKYPYTAEFDLLITEENDAQASIFSGYDGRLQVAGKNGNISNNRKMFSFDFGYDVPLNKKVHVTVVGTQQNTKLYVDGQIISANKLDKAEAIGGNNTYGSFPLPLEKIGEGFKGNIANIKVYNKALRPEIIAGTIEDQANVAQNMPNSYDSQRPGQGGWDVGWKKLHVGWKAFDGDGLDLEGTTEYTEPDSMWEGTGNADDSLMVDLQKERELDGVELHWWAQKAGNSFEIQVSNDGENFTVAETVTGNTAAKTIVAFDEPVKARYVKLQGVFMNAEVYSLYEMFVLQDVDKTALNESIAKAEAVAKELAFENVTAENEDLFHTLVLAKSLVNNAIANQEKVDKTTERLTTLVDQHVEPDPEVDVSELLDLITEAKSYTNTDDMYTKASFQALQDTIVSAENVLENATNQEEVTNMLSKLQTAIDDLEEIEQKPDDDEDDQDDPDENGDENKGDTGEDETGKEEENQHDTDEDEDEAEEDEDKELPNTATSIYNWLVMGLLLLSLGGISIFVTRRKKQKES
ncbi:family 20 glycosylhydrolase [Paraliobacillus sp. PM-2]|uniref:family 20 glycosylhydrolase n=1 Tax=Paraliobacillus sp. PM-2 TaxID=1462524 RepID=UPI00159EC4CA|nr:family 20 glycosylhydrolase [Paraliobacillus sp. PM-2]